MIDDKVALLAKEFTTSVSATFNDYSFYKLDYSFPSIGVLDLLLYGLRNKKELSKFDRHIILSSSAYLGLIAHDCWRAFPDKPEIQVTLSEHSYPEIILRAKGGAFLEDINSFVVPITRMLTEVLQSPKNPLPTFSSSTRLITSESNLLSPVASGLVSGLCPYGKGDWLKLTEKRFADNIIAVCSHLASDYAEFYAQHFPLDTLCATSDFYSPCLTILPAGHNERFLGIRSVNDLHSVFKAKEVTEDNMRKTSINLAQSPDDLLSLTGFAFASALSTSDISPRLLSIAENKGIIASSLRPAYMLARDLCGKTTSSCEYLENKDLENAISQIKIEQRLGFLPLLFIDDLDFFHTPHMGEFLVFLSWMKIQEAIEFLDLYHLFVPLTSELKIQKAFLYLYLNQIDKAQKELTECEENLSDQSQGVQFNYYYMKGRLAALSNNIEEQVKHYMQAITYRTINDKCKLEIVNYLALHFATQDKLKIAFKLLNNIITTHSYSIYTRLVLIKLLIHSNQQEEAFEQLNKCFELNKTNPIFVAMLKDKLSNDILEKITTTDTNIKH